MGLLEAPPRPQSSVEQHRSSGATGAVATLEFALVRDFGLGHLFYALLFAGAIQILFGLVRMGRFVHLISTPVMIGFVNGLSLVIAISQLGSFRRRGGVTEEDGLEVDSAVTPQGEGGAGLAHGRRLSVLSSLSSPDPWLEGAELGWTIFHTLVAMGVALGLPKLTKAVPSSLVAVLTCAILEYALVRPTGFQTQTVGDIAGITPELPSPAWETPDIDIPALDSEVFTRIIGVAITISIVGLLESWLTLELLDDITNTKGDPNREALAQGTGNIVSGLFGGIGGCALIGQSLINVKSGGSHRLSSATAALFLLIIIMAAFPVINAIPVGSLAGMMFVVVLVSVRGRKSKGLREVRSSVEREAVDGRLEDEQCGVTSILALMTTRSSSGSP